MLPSGSSTKYSPPIAAAGMLGPGGRPRVPMARAYHRPVAPEGRRLARRYRREHGLPDRRRPGYVRHAGVQQVPSARLLLEIEVLAQVAQDLGPLAHVRAGIGTAIGSRVQALAGQEVVLDELQVRVEAQRLMIDIAGARVRTDHEAGHAEPVSLAVHRRRPDMVVETAPVVPGQKDRRGAPVGALHDRVDHPRHVVLTGADSA